MFDSAMYWLPTLPVAMAIPEGTLQHFLGGIVLAHHSQQATVVAVGIAAVDG